MAFGSPVVNSNREKLRARRSAQNRYVIITMNPRKALTFSIVVSAIATGVIGLLVRSSFKMVPVASLVSLFIVLVSSLFLAFSYFRRPKSSSQLDRIFGALGALVLSAPMFLISILKIDFPTSAFLGENNGLLLTLQMLAFAYGFLCYTIAIAHMIAKRDADERVTST